MDIREIGKELSIIVIAALILALSVSFLNMTIFWAALLSFAIIILTNVIVKKIIGNYLETDVKTKFWSWYQFGFTKYSHFKKPVPMAWLPLVASLVSKGMFWWLAILEFDVEAKPERASRKHGLYRFTEVTEWHMAWIAVFGIAINLVLSIVGYLLGFEFFAKLNIYFAFWSIIPLSNLDGSKILFGNRILWFATTIITTIFLFYSFIVV